MLFKANTPWSQAALLSFEGRGEERKWWRLLVGLLLLFKQGSQVWQPVFLMHRYYNYYTDTLSAKEIKLRVCSLQKLNISYYCFTSNASVVGCGRIKHSSRSSARAKCYTYIYIYIILIIFILHSLIILWLFIIIISATKKLSVSESQFRLF